jgi:hypothetical protein
MFAPREDFEEANESLDEIAETYWDYLGVYWQDMLGYALAAIAAVLLWNVLVGRRRAEQPWVGERWLRLALVVVLIGVGLWRAYANATCFDDAYISLRYAENFVAGKGLIWNEGEAPVEGYTNFLWTLLISVVMWLTPVEAPLIAVLGSMLAFAINLWVVWRISLRIAPPFHGRAFAFPLAVALLAVQNIFTDYGTTGLETAFASLLVNLGVLALISDAPSRPNPSSEPKSEPQTEPRLIGGATASFWAGLCWIMATLTRPDHALFYAIGSLVVFVTWVRPAWRARQRGLEAIWREGLRPMATYAAPFVIWLIYAAWKLRYYGELLPNTYYAKSADLTYYSQGLIYAAVFHLSSHLWLVILAVLLVWPWRRPSNPAARRFMVFAVPAVLLYEWYVIRVGGDFMDGRFYVTLIPLILLCGEQLVHELARPRPTPTPTDAPPRRAPLRAGAVIMIALMASTAIGIRMIGPRKIRWRLTDETTYYPIAEWSPLVVDHPNYRVGLILRDINHELADRDVDPPILGSGAIGLLGYYSQMTMIDRLGLTDKHVARQKLKKRGRPGHEKFAKREYLNKRGVHFMRGGSMPRWAKSNARIRWGPNTGGRRWYMMKYDRELMQAIREVAPDVWFQDFEIYLDRYIARLPYSKPKTVRKEFAQFKTYYFDHNDDPERRDAFVTYFQWVREGREPRDLLDDGRWDEYKKRAALANQRERELREARAERQRIAAGRPPPPKPKPKPTPRPTASKRPVPSKALIRGVSEDETEGAEDDETGHEDDETGHEDAVTDDDGGDDEDHHG